MHAATHTSEDQLGEEVARIGLRALHAEFAVNEFVDPRQQVHKLRFVFFVIPGDEGPDKAANTLLQHRRELGVGRLFSQLL